jgi:ferredoxin
VQNTIMAIKKVWIEHGCISAGYCNETCPEVFGLSDFGEAYIEDDADLANNEEKIKKAVRECPVKVIKYAED